MHPAPLPTTTAPRLETARLILDAHGTADFAPMASMWADPDTTRHIGPPSSEQESWGRLLRYRGLWPLLGFGYWAVRTSDTGRFVGDVGFADFHRDLSPSIQGMAEAGWVLADGARAGQQQRLPKAMAAALAWLDAQPGHGRSVCLINPANGPSLRLAAKLGYGGGVTVRPAFGETLLLTRPRPAPFSAAGPASIADASAP